MTASVAPAGGTGVGGIRRGVAAALASASAALAALWRRVVPVVSRAARPLRIVTPLGWGLIILGLIAAGVGSRFGWGELIAIAAGCAAAVVFAVPFVLGRSTFAARTELATSRVVVGERAVGRVVVRNDSARASLPVRIELPVGRARASFRLPRLAPGEESDELFMIPTNRRAVLRVGPITSVRADPLPVLERSVRWSEPSDLYVHPRTVSLASETTGFLRDLEGLPTRDLADDDMSFHALREYAPGDDLRNVHWRSTARTQRLMIRQFEQTRRSHLVVALSTRSEHYADADEFELAVSTAASVGLAALRNDKVLTVVTSAERFTARTMTHLLDRCSGLEAQPGADGLETIGRAIATDAPGASVVIAVTGSLTTPPEVRRLGARVPVAARTSCVRAAADEPVARRVIGDIAMVSIPTLDTLRQALRGLE